MSDLLVIVPTKGRPQLIDRLLSSILTTSDEPLDVVLVICQSEIDDYDAAIRPVWAVLRERHPQCDIYIHVTDDDANYPIKINAAADAFASSYRYLAIFNDDHEPITPGWDVLMKTALENDRFGVAYGPDGIWDGQVPTAPMITSTMYKALGWIALPALQHILIDNVWMDLATATGTLHYLPDVRIQHHHVDNGEAPMDATYAETQNNEARNQSDREQWWHYTKAVLPDDVARLEAL